MNVTKLHTLVGGWSVLDWKQSCLIELPNLLFQRFVVAFHIILPIRYFKRFLVTAGWLNNKLTPFARSFHRTANLKARCRNTRKFASPHNHRHVCRYSGCVRPVADAAVSDTYARRTCLNCGVALSPSGRADRVSDVTYGVIGIYTSSVCCAQSKLVPVELWTVTHLISCAVLTSIARRLLTQFTQSQRFASRIFRRRNSQQRDP